MEGRTDTTAMIPDLAVSNSIDSSWYIERFSNGVIDFHAYCFCHKNGFWWFHAGNGKHQTVAKFGPFMPSEDMFNAWCEYARLLFDYADREIKYD